MNSGYSAADIYAMQKEAEQRVFEMQRRARKTLELETPEESIVKEQQTEHPIYNHDNQYNTPAPKNTVPETQNNEHTVKKDYKGIADFLLQDEERALIVLLLLILIRENSDESLLLVLLYLMMEPS